MDHVACHGEKASRAVELSLGSVRALRDLGLTYNVKAVPGRGAFRVGVEPAYPPPRILLRDIIDVSSAVWVVRMEDEAYTVEDIALFIGLQDLLERRPRGGVGGRCSATVGLIKNLCRLLVSVFPFPQNPRCLFLQFLGNLIYC
jgi:hypothetical protein